MRALRVFSILSGIQYGLFLPVWILEMQTRGVSLFQLGILGAVLEVSKLVIEIPTGAFADRYGKKTSIQIGALLWIISWVVFANVHSMGAILLFHLLLANAESFISGAFEGLVSVSTNRGAFHQSYTRLTALTLVSLTLTSVISGYSYGFLKSDHFNFNICVACLLFISTFFLKSNSSVSEKARVHLSTSKIISDGFKYVRSSRVLMKLLIASACFNFLMDGANRYWQPLLVERHVAQSAAGWVIGLSTFITTIALVLQSRFVQQWNRRGLIIVDSLAFVGSILVAKCSGLRFMTSVIGLLSLESFRNPLYQSCLEAEIGPDHPQASTIFSFGSWAGAFGEAISGLILGFVAKEWGLSNVFMSGGVVCAFVLVLEVFSSKRKSQSCVE